MSDTPERLRTPGLPMSLEFWTILCEAPPSQIDESVRVRLREIRDRGTVASDDILHLLDDAVYASLASDFVVKVLNILWEAQLAREHDTVESAIKRAWWRKDR